MNVAGFKPSNKGGRPKGSLDTKPRKFAPRKRRQPTCTYESTAFYHEVSRDSDDAVPGRAPPDVPALSVAAVALAMPVATLPALATTDPLQTLWCAPRVSRVAARLLVPLCRGIHSSGIKRFFVFCTIESFRSYKNHTTSSVTVLTIPTQEKSAYCRASWRR